MFKFSTRIIGEKVPVDFSLPVIPVILPRSDMALHGSQIWNSPVKALPIQGAELDLRHVEPAAMLRCVIDFETFCQPSGLLMEQKSSGGTRGSG